MVFYFRLITPDTATNPKEFQVGVTPVLVGRDASRVDVVLTSGEEAGSISRVHAHLIAGSASEGDTVWVKDMSSNGVMLNFCKVKRPGDASTSRVRDFSMRLGDTITFGGYATELSYEMHADAKAAIDSTAPSLSCSMLWASANPMGTEHETRVLGEVKETQSVLLSLEDDRAVSSSTEFPKDSNDETTVQLDMLAYLAKTYNTELDVFNHTMPIDRLARKVVQICDAFCDSRREECENTSRTHNPWFTHIEAPAYLFGDLHGSYADLKNLVDRTTPFGDIRFAAAPLVFLGDYVDRGAHSVEVVVSLIAMRLLSPKLVHLLRGNHEDPAVNGDRDCAGAGCFLQSCETLFGAPLGRKVWTAANRAFSYLPLCGEVGRQIFLCHGGMPRGNMSILRDEPHKFRAFKTLVGDEAGDTPQEKFARDLMWTDPCKDDDYGEELYRPNERCTDGSIVAFTNLALDKFFEETGYSLIIRAHQYQPNGIRVSKRGRVVTVFSSSAYGDETRAGVVIVLPDYTVKLVTFAPQFASCVESCRINAGTDTTDEGTDKLQPMLGQKAPRLANSAETSLTMLPKRNRSY